ncbi:MAG: hypothetical protein RJQ09_13565 [Cyclobacteriaceae bacterium]
MRKGTIITCLLWAVLDITAQELIPIGDWRSHFNYDKAKVLEVAGQKIYCATDNGLFYFDNEDNSVNRLTKVDGFSDIGISALKYDRNTNWLIIGYTNGNVDLFNEDQIVNFDLIEQEQIIGSKRINAISIFEGLAYLATDFGVVVFDLGTQKIRETFENLGPAGEKVAVNDCAIRVNELFLATSIGVISASLNSSLNLLDFRNWLRFNSGSEIDSTDIKFIEASAENVIAATDSIYTLQGDIWINSGNQFNEVLGLRTVGNSTLISTSNALFQLSPEGLEQITYSASGSPNDAIIAGNILFIADENQGLFRQLSGGFEKIQINGPTSNDIFDLHFHDGKIYALPGGFTDNGFPLGNQSSYSIFENGVWQTFETRDLNFNNLSAIINDPISEQPIIGSFGDGLLTISDQTTFRGAPLEESSKNPGAIEITGLGFDSEGNLLVTNHGSNNPIHRLDPQGAWNSFNFSAPSTEFPLSLTINEFDDIWMRLSPAEGGGIFVFNQVTNDTRLLSTSEGFGNLPNRHVTEIVFDLQGQAWIGTAQGIAFIPNPFAIFDADGFDAIRPVFENRFLLEDDLITAIAVDGGNRKWIGTDKGIWLFEDSGERLVFNFTIENSPLPSNQIIDIEVNQVNGEVFISTLNGTVSFRSASSSADEKHNDVKIFPNPVKPGYTGLVGISGLAEDAIVKITDIGGRLISEVQAAGGTASWDVKGFGGNAASSGIYLVFSSSQDGNETFVGKIAVIR